MQYLITTTLDQNMEIDFIPPTSNTQIAATSNIPYEDLVNFELTDEIDEHYQPVPGCSKGKSIV